MTETPTTAFDHLAALLGAFSDQGDNIKAQVPGRGMSGTPAWIALDGWRRLYSIHEQDQAWAQARVQFLPQAWQSHGNVQRMSDSDFWVLAQHDWNWKRAGATDDVRMFDLLNLWGSCLVQAGRNTAPHTPMLPARAVCVLLAVAGAIPDRLFAIPRWVDLRMTVARALRAMPDDALAEQAHVVGPALATIVEHGVRMCVGNGGAHNTADSFFSWFFEKSLPTHVALWMEHAPQHKRPERLILPELKTVVAHINKAPEGLVEWAKRAQHHADALMDLGLADVGAQALGHLTPGSWMGEVSRMGGARVIRDTLWPKASDIVRWAPWRGKGLAGLTWRSACDMWVAGHPQPDGAAGLLMRACMEDILAQADPASNKPSLHAMASSLTYWLAHDPWKTALAKASVDTVCPVGWYAQGAQPSSWAWGAPEAAARLDRVLMEPGVPLSVQGTWRALNQALGCVPALGQQVPENAPVALLGVAYDNTGRPFAVADDVRKRWALLMEQSTLHQSVAATGQAPSKRM